ncbi:MAG: sigma-70 family RNA polymerase sigma factor [Clostridia bacterium]|nr:sigma-70 family RNA polymerase sigma factor [Clostridia bacterium]
MKDGEIIRLTQARDEVALQELEEKYGKRLRNIARGILRNEEDVSECVNDVYLKAWDNIPLTRPENLEAYLTTLTRNAAISRVREDNAQKRIPAELIGSIDDAESGAGQIPSADNTAEEVEALSAEARIKAVLVSYVRELPERDKKIFVARYHYDASVKSIANRLGIPSGTVKSTLHRLRTGLAERLKKEGIEL